MESALDAARRAAREHAHEIVAAYRQGWLEGDWRAADAFLTRVFGKPTEHVVTSTADKPDEWEPDDLDRELARLLAEGSGRYPSLPSLPLAMRASEAPPSKRAFVSSQIASF